MTNGKLRILEQGGGAGKTKRNRRASLDRTAEAAVHTWAVVLAALFSANGVCPHAQSADGSKRYLPPSKSEEFKPEEGPNAAE